MTAQAVKCDVLNYVGADLVGRQVVVHVNGRALIQADYTNMRELAQAIECKCKEAERNAANLVLAKEAS